MFNLHCTQKLRDRLKSEVSPPAPVQHWLGSWYATSLPWRPQMALLVNEQTLLPVLMPLAPATTMVQRIPGEILRVIQALDLSTMQIEAELDSMHVAVVCKTASRSMLGTMNEFCFLAEGYRGIKGMLDPLSLSLTLAKVPCGGKTGYRYPVDLVKQKLLH
jgi:hypothetical protein